MPPTLRERFAEAPILYQVAQCESQLHQFDEKGSVLYGTKVYEDTGILQINATYHLAEAQKLGFDIYTLEGNIGFGIWLYKQQGLQPWMASSYCWSKYL